MHQPDCALRRFALATAGAALIAAAVTVLLMVTAGTPTAQRVTLIALPVCGILTWATGKRRIRHSVGRRAKAWRVMSSGALFAVTANLWTLFADLFSVPLRAHASDALLLLALGFCAAGLTLFPPRPRRPADLIRIVLDGFVVGGSVLFVASVNVFPQLVTDTHAVTLASRLQTLFLPFTDVLIATMATMLIATSGRFSRVPLVLLGVGFLLYAMSDLAYAVRNTGQPGALGTLWDLGWIVGYLLFAMAAVHPAARGRERDESHETSPVLTSVVIFAVFLAATVVSLAHGGPNDISVTARLIWGGVILAVVGRQTALLIDNERLRRSLTKRVLERTRDLREITRRQELVFTSVADGIYGVDRRGDITVINSAASSLLGMTTSDLIGRNAHHLFHAPAQDGVPFPGSACYITEAITSGLTASAEEDVYVRGDGRLITVEATASPLNGDDGISGAVVVFRDVSQRREMNRMKSEFVSFVSHELRTPLTSMRGALGLLAGGAFGTLPSGAARALEIATTGSERLSRLVNDILDIERIDAGKLSMVVADHEVGPLCREAVATVSGITSSAGVEIVLGTCEGAVRADADRVVQILVNLLGNAVKFSQPGSMVHVEAVPRDDVVEFKVSDSGRGVPSDKLEFIFERFTQVKSSDAREKNGTGLGLAICRSIAERSGGRIWAESTLGLGSTFHVLLPRASTCPDQPTQDTGAGVTSERVR